MSRSEQLRPLQAVVVGAAEHRHARLLAGPGTGKTTVLVRRAEFLLNVLDPGDTLLALTFTRAAAAEMRTRLDERLGERAERVRVSTLHAYSLGQLLNNENASSRLSEPLRIVGDWEQRHVVEEELAYLTGRPVRGVRNALTALENDWNTLTADGEAWEADHSDPVFIAAWATHRTVYGYTLRGELVYQFLTELRQDPGLEPSPRPAVVLVDEYQDLNSCDLEAIRELSYRTDAAVFAAGDDDQSIYGFRAAAPEGIRTFGSTYPEATDLRLTECMRCGPEVVDLANWLIGQEPRRLSKELVSASGVRDRVDLVLFRNQNDEAVGLAQFISAVVETGMPPEQVLMLFRKDAGGRASVLLDEQLTAAGLLTYRPRANDERDLDLVRLQFYLQLALSLASGDVDHVSLRGLLELEDNRVGQGTLRAVLDLAIEEGRRFADTVDIYRHAPRNLGTAAHRRLLTAVDEIYERAGTFVPEPGESTDAYVGRVAAAVGVDDEGLSRLQLALAPLAGGPGEPGSAARQQHELLAALSGLADTQPATVKGHVTLTTMHGAKGLTADLVVVCQVEDEELPGDAPMTELNELRRLLYVSVTRARRQLVLSLCGRRTGAQAYGRAGPRARRQRLTRFLADRGLSARRIDELLPR